MKELPPQVDFDFQKATEEGLKLGLGVGVAPGILFCALNFYTENRGPKFMESLTDMKTIMQTAFLMVDIFGISALSGVVVKITPALINNLKDWKKNDR